MPEIRVSTSAVKLAKESKCELMRASISTSAATSEQLRNLLADQRSRRGQHAAVVSLVFDGNFSIGSLPFGEWQMPH